MSEGAQPTAFKVADSSCYVKIRYRCKVSGGPVLKGAGEPEIMDFITGYAQVIPGLEKRLIGRCPGERMAFAVPAEEAFGPRYPELVVEKNRADFRFPAGFEPHVGMEIPVVISRDEGPDTARIREIRADTIVIDFNHPLSGVTLEYDLEILESRPAKPTEVCEHWDEQGTDAPCAAHVHSVVLGDPAGVEK